MDLLKQGKADMVDPYLIL